MNCGKRINEEYQIEINLSDEESTQEFPIFHQKRFFEIHARESLDKFITINRISDGKAVGSFFLGDGGDSFLSPLRGSYGGLYLSSASRDISLIRDTLDWVVSFVQENKGRKLMITLPPMAYDEDFLSEQSNVLLGLGFKVARCEINYSSHVDANFIQSWHHGNRKRLRQCVEDGFECDSVNIDGLEEVYGVLAQNRAQRGRALSMAYENIKTMFEKFPTKMYAHRVKSKDGSVVAASISMRIENGIHYVFYWGEVAAHNRSPVVMIANEIFNLCMGDGCRILDLGVSTLDGVPNLGLIRFKKNLGCKASLKFTFSRDFLHA